MFQTRLDRCCVLAAVLTVLACLLFAPAVQAEGPQKVFRYFAVVAVPPGYPDFTSEESVVVVAHPRPDEPSGRLRFAATWAANPEWLRGSYWLLASATHVTTGQPAGGSFAWPEAELAPSVQAGLPPSGAVAKAGPEGDIVVLAKYWIVDEQDTGSCGTDCGLRVLGEDDGNPPPGPIVPTMVMWICAGWFTK